MNKNTKSNAEKTMIEAGFTGIMPEQELKGWEDELALLLGRQVLACVEEAFRDILLHGTPWEQNARYLWRLLQGHDGETARTLLRRSKFRRMDQIWPALKILVDHGYLMLEQVPNPGARPSTVVHLNPEAVKDTAREAHPAS